MFKLLKKRIKNEKGLSLVELLAVIVILAIVAAIAIPAIGNIIEKQRDKAVLADAQTIISGAKLALADGACSSDTSCTGTELLDFVEIPTLVVGDTVTKDSTTGEYTITWTFTNEHPGHTFNQITDGNDLTTGMTESDIRDALD